MEQQQKNQLTWKIQQNPKELDLSYCVFVQDIEFITYLKSPQAKQMQSLNLSHTLLTDAALLQLSFMNLKTLKYLNLSYCVNFTEGAIVNLLNSDLVTNVETLNLSGNQLTDVCLKFLFQPNKMKYLAQLILNDIKKGQSGFSYKFFEMLSQTNLTKSLINLSVGNSFIQTDQLQMSKAQTIMNAFFTRIIKEDHTYFYQLSLKSTQIQTLTLFKCDLLTNKFIKMLCRNVVFMSSLKQINIGHCKLLNDKICNYLSEAGASVQRLEDLELLGLNITFDGLDKIIKSKSLRLQHFGLAMCDEIQAEHIKILMDSKFGKQLTSLELSGSHSMKCQVLGMISQDQIIWKDFNLKTLYIELYVDQNCYYQYFGKQQLQFQQQQSLNSSLNQIDPYYKAFFETHMYLILDQIIFIKKIKVVLKVQHTDEEIIATFLTNFIEQNNLLDHLLINDNQLFVNQICILSYVLKTITKTSAKIFDFTDIQKQNPSIIQLNYLDPIEKEKISVSQIRNLVLMKQDFLKDEDLALVGKYSDTIFSQLSYVQIKGCKQITKRGLNMLGEKLFHQLQFLDVRKTQIKLQDHASIISQFYNLTSFNNNKIYLEFNQKNHKDDLLMWLNLLFRLLQLKKISIKNMNKTCNFNMSLLRFIAQMLKNNHLSMKKLYIQIFLNIEDFQLYQEESITELSESLQLSFNLKTFYFEIFGQIKHQLIIDIFNTLINTQIVNLQLQIENCKIIDELCINKQSCVHYFQNLEFSSSNISQLDIIFYHSQQLESLTGTVSILDKFDSLIQLLTINQLANLKLDFIQIKLEQFIDILSSINVERMINVDLTISNIIINETGIQKIQEFLLKCKKINCFTISMIGCGCTRQLMEKYFKSNLQILKIPQLKFYY